MRWLASKRIAIKSIVLPGNFAATKAAARIADLATSLRETDGPIHLPIVRAKTMELGPGHDRIAALMMLKEKRVEVRMWEGTDQEFARILLMENLYRRHDDRPALIAELARVEAGIIRKEADEAGTTVPSTQSVTKEARKRVAAAVGIKPASVKKAEQRAAKDEASSTADPLVGGSKHAPAVEAKPAPLFTSLPDGFNAFGLEVSPGDRERIVESAQALGAWARNVTNLLTELARVEKVANPLIDARVAETIRERAHALGHVIREAIPTSLCFYCKNDDRAVVNCPACGSTGFVGRHAGDNVPPELKTTGVAARISLDGRFILHDTIVGSKGGTPLVVTPQFRRAQKKIRVVTVDREGAETEVNLDEVPPDVDKKCICGHPASAHDDVGGDGCRACVCEMLEIENSDELAF